MRSSTHEQSRHASNPGGTTRTRPSSPAALTEQPPVAAAVAVHPKRLRSRGGLRWGGTRSWRSLRRSTARSGALRCCSRPSSTCGWVQQAPLLAYLRKLGVPLQLPLDAEACRLVCRERAVEEEASGSRLACCKEAAAGGQHRQPADWRAAPSPSCSAPPRVEPAAHTLPPPPSDSALPSHALTVAIVHHRLLLQLLLQPLQLLLARLNRLGRALAPPPPPPPAAPPAAAGCPVTLRTPDRRGVG